HAVAGHDRAEAVGEAVHDGCAHAVGGRAAGVDHGAHAAIDQQADERRAEERTRLVLGEYEVFGARGDERVDLGAGGSLDGPAVDVQQVALAAVRAHGRTVP